MSKTHKNLVETSNQHHNAVCDYLYEYGADMNFRVAIIGKYRWLKMIAKEYEFEVEEQPPIDMDNLF